MAENMGTQTYREIYLPASSTSKWKDITLNTGQDSEAILAHNYLLELRKEPNIHEKTFYFIRVISFRGKLSVSDPDL